MKRRDFLKTLGIVVAAASLPAHFSLPTASKPQDSVPLGTVQGLLGNHTLPEGWVLCDGRSLQVSEYPELFLEIEQYTHGNDWVAGETTFKLPDLRSKLIRAKSSVAIKSENVETMPRNTTTAYFIRIS